MDEEMDIDKIQKNKELDEQPMFLASEVPNPSVANFDKIPPLYTPGESIVQEEGLLRGHGTYSDHGYLKASLAGVKEVVNKLISIRPLKCRYDGDIGDVVIGRIIEIQHKKWRVETNSRMDSTLLLSSVNLPGGELRRRSDEDVHLMRKYLQEGDLISAEVQNVFHDGGLSLHTRSLKYGKLGEGVLLKVFPSLIRRSKTHFHNLPCGASIILGRNGYIWITEPMNSEPEDSEFTGTAKIIPLEVREVISRLRNCILALVQSKMMLYDTSITFAYEVSLKYSIPELILPEAMIDVALLTAHRLRILKNS